VSHDRDIFRPTGRGPFFFGLPFGLGRGAVSGGGEPGSAPNGGREPPGRQPPIITPLVPLAQPLPSPRPPFGFPPADIRQLPLPGANEPFGGNIIRIGRILRGVGLGALIIIAAEILVREIARRQIASLDKILKDQDDEIARNAIERALERARIKQVTIEPGRLPLPQLDLPSALPEILPPRPVPDPASRLPAPVELPQIPGFELPGIFPVQFPDIPAPLTLPTVVDPGLTPEIFGRIAAPAPLTLPLPFPITSPRALPVPFEITFPVPTPIGDPIPPPLTPVDPRLVTLGFVDLPGIDPVPQPDTAQQRCQTVKRRRRRKGKCREGFFVELPGETQFTTWRERDCTPVERALEIVR